MLSAKKIVFLILFIFKYGDSSLRIDPLVDTNVGLIRGIRANDGDYAMFLGIPYAQVDEDNPFGASKPQSKFDETFEAYDDSAKCPQVYQLDGTILGKADCLHLNVYVPSSATSNNLLPVMVWLYGGAFRCGYFGKDFFGPNYFVKHDVIVVIPNYRVGAYGFMCLGTPEVPGNQGLKDQYIAMQWIKDNIAAFGGDADRITLFGNSAGAHSIDFHLISPKEKLYNKVILQSGSSSAATVLYEPDRLAALKLADMLGFKTNNTNEAISFLAKVEPSLVVAAAIDLDIIFKPCVENEFDGVEPFIAKPWVNAGIPKVENMPVLIGFTENEMTFHVQKDAQYFQNLNIISDYLERVFSFEGEKFEEMKSLVSHFYFGEEAINIDMKWDVIRFDSDFTYIHPIQRTIQKYLEAGARDIYHYMFSYIGARNAIITDDDDEHNNMSRPCCVSHADEVSYLFDASFRPQLTSKDKIFVERITTMWTNFAKYSDPTPQTSELLPVKWVPLTKEDYTYMNIGEELSLGRRPYNRRMAFWNLFYKLNQKYHKTFDSKK